MRKEKFVYNPHTLRYEKVQEPLKRKALRWFGFFSAALVTACIMYLLTYTYFPSPKEQALMREIEQMEYKYYALNNQLNVMEKVVDNIQDRDAGVHRMVFGMEPIDQAVWEGGTGGHNKYENLTKYKHTGDLLIATQDKADMLERKLVIQSRSLDTLQALAKDREKMFASIPSIKPIRTDKLKRSMKLLSGYGMRFHPIHKVRKMHTGIDFTAPRGTAVQATGQGKVVRIKRDRSGYGNSILIDHGYGYQTLYAHMKQIDVEIGEEVLKGQKIGTVGSSGTSTAPHCHYEVRLNGKTVNPIHYCMDGLTPEEYQELCYLASVSNQSFD